MTRCGLVSRSQIKLIDVAHMWIEDEIQLFKPDSIQWVLWVSSKCHLSDHKSLPGTKVKCLKFHFHSCMCLHSLVLETHGKIIHLKPCIKKAYRACGWQVLHIINLGIKWRRVVNFTLAPWSLRKVPAVLTWCKALWSHLVWLWW